VSTDAAPTNADPRQRRLRRYRRLLNARFSLRQDKADDAEIEARIRDGVELRGATPWILMFAIIVASVGLNVNSTAVIIGAMLISPLMGPIMGAGLGLAVLDFDLARRSLANLAIATGISLVVSALYFMLTPLREAQSELLARTTPTLWDVLIALFGGLAGIVGITRREKSNVIPGVAIATALMPPVCTAGFGLATGNWRFFGGAMYLYAINCVFIAVATAVGVRAVGLRARRVAGAGAGQRVRVGMWVLALGTALPSVYLAVNLVRQEVFRAQAQQFVAGAFVFAHTQVIETRIDPARRSIDVSLIGEPVPPDQVKVIEQRLASERALEGAHLVLHQVGDAKFDVTALKTSLLNDLLRESQVRVQERDERIRVLTEAQALREQLPRQADDLVRELRSLYPEVGDVVVGEGLIMPVSGGRRPLLYLVVSTPRPLPAAARQRLTEWFKSRTKTDAVQLRFEVEARPLQAARRP